ncbi:hypothetical protein [Bacillus seohaeanensis]|jgi:hypothetical protein|uniref:DUF4025 domain-containing protein n=1 Tax=Bacillus seohaeanensis TaxID=284580 RepID=A0ABW5RSC4_9BACI
MKRKNFEHKYDYDEQASQQVSNQIMGAYSSGVIDSPDGSYNPYEDQENQYE